MGQCQHGPLEEHFDPLLGKIAEPRGADLFVFDGFAGADPERYRLRSGDHVRLAHALRATHFIEPPRGARRFRAGVHRLRRRPASRPTRQIDGTRSEAFIVLHLRARRC